MSLYDRLTNKLGDDNEDSAGNLTPLDIADLPPAQRKVMFSLLRDTKAATEGITLAGLNTKLDNPENLANTLTELVQSGWMIEALDITHVFHRRGIQAEYDDSGYWPALPQAGRDRHPVCGHG